jgi:hypothetical protein
MSSRLLSLRRGKTGDVQSFSRARPADPAMVALIQSTFGPGINDVLRMQILSDPANVHQFACTFGDTFGFFTRPTVVNAPNGDMIVVGSFTDTIGEPVPCYVPLDEFQGHYTTLVRREDSVTFNLAIHPSTPDTVEGPTIRGAAEMATMARLNFHLPDNPGDGDYPVIAALPLFLPVGPGQTFPHILPAGDARTFRDTFPLFEIWRQGIIYAKTHNGGRSVTHGGPLFNLANLRIPPGEINPFESLGVRNTVTDSSLLQILPIDPLYNEGRDRFLAWSDTVWVELGSAMDPEPVPAIGVAGGGFTPEHFRAAMEPLVAKEKVFSSAVRTTSRYRLLLAGAPTADSVHPDHAVLPDLRDEFKAYLTVASSAVAGDDLRELVKSRLSIANGSHISIDKDTTLESDNITLAFSDRVRTFGFLSEKLILTSHVGAKGLLGLLQLLTPERDALAAVAEGDQEAATLLMSNSTSGSAQLDASKASRLYCTGRLTTFRHSYEAVCNFRCLVSVMVPDLSTPLVLVKLLEYSALLVDRQGRGFFDAYCRSPYLAVHPWQDLQSILSAFCRIATDSTLYGAVTRGDPVGLSNYRSAIDVADALIAELRAIVNGNGLGKFEGTPSCAPWFAPVGGASPKSPFSLEPRAPTGAVGGGDSKRQKTADTGAKKPAADPADLERRKGLGLLTFDSAIAGTTRLPPINVYHKAKNAKTPERLCMKFLTRGHACETVNCKLPHLPGVEALTPASKTKLIEFVKKQPGISWAEGKAPAGTS